MSTRAVIAKPQGDAWAGKYHHSDGYPAGLGLSLMEHYASEHFAGDVDAMVAEIVDAEPVGWSLIIGTDFAEGAGWDGFDRSSRRPQSYAARGDEATGAWITPDDEGSWCEWCYVLCPSGVLVWERSGNAWRGRGLVPWTDPAAMVALDR